MTRWRDRLRQAMDDDPVLTVLSVPFAALMATVLLGMILVVLKATWHVLFVADWGGPSGALP